MIMYHYTLKILIISDSSNLQQKLERVKPKEKFQHTFETVSKYDKTMAESDIIIVDSNESFLKEIYETKAERCILVFYGKKISSYEYVDDVWVSPICDDGLLFCFNKLLLMIKKDKESIQSKAYLETLINNSQDLIWFKDIKGSHVKVNDAFCKTVNKKKEDVEGRGHYYIWDITPDDYSKGEFVCLESEEMVIEAEKTMVFDEPVKTADGMRQFVTVKSPIFNEFGEVVGTVGCAKDVTDFNNVTREINIFFENIPFGVIISDMNDVIREVNTRMEELTGWSKEEIINTPANMNYPRLKKEATDSLDDNVDIVEFDVNGYKKTLEMTKVTITDVFKKPIGKMRFFKDITQERLLEIQVLHNSNTDFLTGLYNRRYFYNYISDYCIGKPLGVLFIDLDNFKSINDTYGHQAGDDALVLTADVLHRNCHDGLIVRNGGDEFIVVTMNDLSLDDVKKRAATLLYDLVSSFKEDSRFKGLSASIGLSFVDRLHEDIDEVLKRCDAAMYSAKKSSKGSYCIARN